MPRITREGKFNAPWLWSFKTDLSTSNLNLWESMSTSKKKSACILRISEWRRRASHGRHSHDLVLLGSLGKACSMYGGLWGFKQLHARLDRQNPWGMSADLSSSNLKKKICLYAEDQWVASARRSRSPVTWPGAARITKEGKFNFGVSDERLIWKLKSYLGSPESMRDEHRFVNIKENLPACRESASGAGMPVTVASHMSWCCSDHSRRQIQCTVVVEFQLRDFFRNL